MQRDNFTFVVNSPTMTAVDPYDGKQYTATFKLRFRKAQGYFFLESNVIPRERDENHSCYYNINDDHTDILCCNGDSQWRDDIKKLTVFVDVSGTRSVYVPPFKKVNHKNLGSCLKEMWKNDSSVKYTIKCGIKLIETYKPFLAVNSLFFKDMFESTTQNFVEITDFQFEVLQKMVEFCETDDIKEVNGYECELFKAAHKYQMNDLMDFVVEKMSENADDSNIFSYLQLAKKYELKEFEKWCMQFALRTNFTV